MNDPELSNGWSGDVLHRKKYASFLTQYLKDKPEGYVININAPWGSGKTFFLNRWFEDVKKEHPAIYFNAWKNDYNHDPFISIISCINQEIVPLLPDSKKESIRKTFLFRSGKVLKKLAPVLLKAGLRKVIGENGIDELAEVTTESEASIIEVSSDVAELFKSHEAISNSIDDFKKSIEELINGVTEDQNFVLPLFVFIDELDRCRPLYSIELLERIKHLFDIPGVVFILATDTQQLSHSVKAVYGENFDGEIYLRRFFDQIYTLPTPNYIEFTQLLFEEFSPQANYFKYNINHEGGSSDKYSPSNNSEENINTLTCTPSDHVECILIFSLYALFFKLDLRTKKQCFDRFIAMEKLLTKKEELHFGFLIFLIMFDAKCPAKFQEYFAATSASNRNDVLKAFGHPVENIRIYEKQLTARQLFEIYSNYTNQSQREQRREVGNMQEMGFEENLKLSLHKNYHYIVQYKERVEMVEALG